MESRRWYRLIIRSPRTLLGWAAATLSLVVLAFALLATLAGFFDRDPIHYFGDFAVRPRPLATVYFSGDMGLRFGMGPAITKALAAQNIPVIGMNSSTLFARHRSRAEVDSIVAQAVRDALARSQADRVILIGQSFGSDVLGTGIAHLPVDLRPRIAMLILVVPGQSVFFRADPTNILYHGKADWRAIDAMRSVTWVPVTCIYGTLETDSLCPLLGGPRISRIPLPGGHFLGRDSERVIRVILNAIRPVASAS